MQRKTTEAAKGWYRDLLIDMQREKNCIERIQKNLSIIQILEYQKVYTILVHANLCHISCSQSSSNYYKLPAMVDSIVVVDLLGCCALIHSMCDLKTAQINVQLIWGLMLYEFQLSHNVMEATKTCFDEGAVDHCTVTRWFKKFCKGCKNFNDQARSGKHGFWSCTPNYRGKSNK